MSLKISGYYGNPNQNTVYDAREDIQYITNFRDNSGLQYNVAKWKQKLQSARFQTIKQTQQTRFLFGISQITLLNTLSNIYDNNNQMEWDEERSVPSYQAGSITIKFPNEYTTLGQLIITLENELNAKTIVGGVNPYAVTINGGGFIVITLTEPLGETWQCGPSNPSANNLQYNTLGLFGLNSTSLNITNIVTAFNLPNIWSGLDTLILQCDAVRWPFQYTDSTNLTRNLQVLCSFPFTALYGETNQFQAQWLEWKETYAFPFQKEITFFLTDIDGIPLIISGILNIKATLRTQLLDAQDAGGQ